MSSKTLRKYYIKYGVRFKRPDYKYWKSLAEKNELQKDQLELVQELGTMIVQQAYDEILYLNETTFKLW